MKNFLASLAAFALLSVAGVANAGSISFSFHGLADGANITTVQNYMQGVVTTAHPGGTVSVTGAVASTSYNGDGHVVGPVNGHTVTSFTLFNMDNNPFIMNAQTTGNDRIKMVFSFPIYSVSFDYEIFPDGTAQQPPDFTFAVGTGGATTVFTQYGAVPASPGYTHSPNSGYNNNETSAQFIGSSGTYTFSGGVTELDFIDWPTQIGLTNLVLGTTPPQGPVAVPEPASLALLGAGLVGLPLLRRRKAPAAARPGCARGRA
jgi:hypothetical protein